MLNSLLVVACVSAVAQGDPCDIGTPDFSLCSPAPVEDSFSPAFVDRTYTPRDVTPHCAQLLNVFHPDSAVPNGGFPVLVVLDLNSYYMSQMTDSFTNGMNRFRDRLAYRALENGFAVVFATMTVARTPWLVQAPIPLMFPTTCEPESGEFGNSYLGNGLHFPPGYDPVPDLEPALPPPYEDNTRPMAIKDVIHIVQHVRDNAVRYQIDPGRLALQGLSASASTAMWVAFGPDRKEGGPGALGVVSDDSQYGQSTIPNAFICELGPTWIRGWESDIGPPRFAVDDDYGVGELVVPVLLNLDEADPVVVEQLSPLTYGDTDALTPPTYLAYNVPPQIGISPYPPYPIPGTSNELICRPHSSSHGEFWEARHPARSRLVMYSRHSDGSPVDYATHGLEDARLTDCRYDDNSALVEDCWTWLQEVLLAPDVTGPDGDPTDGDPDLLIADFVSPGEQEEIEVRWSAQPGSVGHLFVQGIPPSGSFAFYTEIPFALDANGRALVSYSFGQDGFVYHVTARFPDFSVPGGYVLSNTKTVTPD